MREQVWRFFLRVKDIFRSFRPFQFAVVIDLHWCLVIRSLNAIMTKNFVFMVAELRRYPQMSYKSDITVLSGLDAGDRKALDQRFRSDDYPNCQIDKEDKRFVLKGPAFNMMEVINTLVQERGYQIEYNPQQHGIPLKAGNVDDKYGFPLIIQSIPIRWYKLRRNFQILHPLPSFQTFSQASFYVINHRSWWETFKSWWAR